MTAPNVRSEIVELLMDLAIDTTTGMLTHQDGQPFSAEEKELFGQARREELNAAREALEERVRLAHSQSTDHKRLMELAQPYFEKLPEGAKLTHVLVAMRPAERREAEQLMQRLSPAVAE